MEHTFVIRTAHGEYVIVHANSLSDVLSMMTGLHPNAIRKANNVWLLENNEIVQVT